MLRDFKFLRRNSGKNEEIENVSENPKDSLVFQTGIDSSRPPLNTIQEPIPMARQEQEVGFRSKVERTPTKAKGKSSDPTLPLRTPDKHGAGFSAKNRFAWAQKHEPGLITGDSRDDGSNYSGQVKGVAGTVNGGLVSMTPRPARVVGRGASSYSESNSTQSTPSKSVSKPPSSGIRSRVDGHTSTRTGNFAALYKGLPISCSPATAVNTMEVPHFDLKEDPSFWMEHSVQVLIRVRPLNSMEKSTHGYNRCLKQESAQTIAWIGQPETRFTFDHVACETVEQETLFRMVGLPMVENCLSGYNSCMFAYGQTGSGKTYTMLGEIDDLEIKPSPHRGMTPRIFEFLFARIQAEEEIRKDEKLKYTCKCSFLEIYNEQITDLLDPSSANLMLREDVKKGVYVENLSEFEVQTVSEILRLLTQGSSNRRVAATNMNRESSRSHSVFTCVIESRWEKDSATNLRFARLNLVDLAGSERQKTSGAEGERLKEAANINKSLSTLGHVIMVLVDVAHGKLRHIPYRDSRLTFLLQDSLGGNSKTMIIANVSPSICCASETLNTLKFAQRAKLIQNNAVVNEDSTGDVIALQHQIRLLKEELSILKRQNVSRSLSFGLTTIEDTTTAQENACMENIHDVNMEIDDIHDVNMEIDDLPEYASKGIVRLSTKQLKSLETTLAGSLRREQMAETSIKQLEAEVEQLNRLVRQREEDTRCSKMMLRFREDKIQRMESLLGGSVPADAYLLEENRALSEEIQLLQAKVDRNPEVTRFALENIRLLDQLRRFQEFYEEGEREILLSEVSALRDQLLQFIDGSSKQHNDLNSNMQPEFKNTLGELEKCRDQLKSCLEDNAKLRRELDDLHTMLENIRYEPYEHDGVNKTIKDSINGPAVEDEVLKVVQSENLEGKHESLLIKHAEEMVNLQLELDILKIIIKEERSTCREMEETAICYDRDLQVAKEKLLLTSKKYEDAKCELEEAKSIIEALESQQILSINEMEELRNTNSHYQQLLSKQEPEIMALKDQLAFKELQFHSPSTRTERDNSPLEANLKRMQASLEKAKRLNNWYRGDRAHQVSNEEEMDEVRRQAEAETAEVIVCMQEELGILQHQVQDSHLKEMEMKTAGTLLETELKEVQEKLYIITDDNKSLNQKLEEKDRELLILSEEWDLLTCEIEEILADGHDTLINASDQLELISSSFPHRRIWISDQVGKMIKIISEKELMIEELRSCLEDANNKRSDVECMLKSLRGAAMVITEAHQQECSEKEKEILQLMSELTTKTSTVAKLEDRNKWAEDQIGKVSGCATVAFVIVNRLSEMNNSYRDALKHKDFQLGESVEMNLRKDALLNDQAEMIEEADKKIQSLRGEVKDLEGTCGKLREKISEEQERSCGMEQKLKTIEEIDILMTKEKLAELQSGVSTLKSCMSSYGEHCGSPARKDSQEVCTSFDGDGEGEGPTDAETNKVSDRDLNCVEDLTLDTSEYSRVGKSVCCPSYDEKNLESRRIGRDMGNKDVTIILLKKEIQSALESLKEVQAEMVKLHDEKKQMQVSEKCSQESMKCLTTQVLAMEAAMSNFEKQYILKTEAFGNRLSVFEQTVEEAGSQWCQTKELLELEVGGAKMVAAQKAAEASCIMAKFQEAQNTMKDADIMINKLVIANEKLKLDIERRKETEVGLINDRSLLTDEVQSLQNINDLKNQQFEDLEKQLGSHLTETRDLVSEIECAITEFQTTLSKNLMSLGCDLRCMKSLLVNSTKLVHSWLEGVWSQIIVKDSAVSVLHLCHMGILLETVTGLNTENGLLQHGLCESNSAIADLRERNFKSIRELEMCRILKGKLLADIKNSFDKISRKEEETGELRVKVSTFEKQISDLQLQEELMLQRSNDMGSQLSILMKELDLSNNNVLACLLDQEKILKYKEMVLESQADLFMVGWFSKDFESLILVSELEEMALQKADAEKEHIKCCSVLENLKKEIIFSKVDAELKTKLLQDQESQVSLLEKQIQEATLERKDLLSKLNVSNSRISQMEEVTDQGIQSLKDVTFLNSRLKVELVDVNETKVRLLNQVQAHEADYENLLHDFKTKERALEVSLSQMSALDERNKDLQKNICKMETFLCELQNELDMKNAELSRMSCLADENESLKGEIMKLNAQKRQVLKDLEGKNSEFESSLSRIGVFHEENQRLQNEIISLEPGIVSLKTELEMKNAEMNELQHSQSVILKELCSRTQDCQSYVNNVKSLEEQNAFLRNEICSHKNTMHESFSISSLNIMKCIDTVEALDIMGSRLLNVLDGKGSSVVDKMSQEISENIERTCKFMEEFDRLECHAKELVSENLNLQAELLRKEDVLRGLLFDLSLLQESASNTKDQKEEIEEMVVSVEALEDELAVKTGELDLALAKIQMLEDQLRDKIDIISVHELDLSKERESLEMLSVENLELGACIEDALAAQSILEEELTEKKKIIESLEMELTEMSNALGLMNNSIESLGSNMNELASERDLLQIEVNSWKEKFERVKTLADKNETIAMEAQQVAESRKVYAEDKETEVKLLERSVEELERTINVLENKVNILKGEAERQRLQREELESELHAVKDQMQNVKNADSDMKRHLDEKEKNLQEALEHMQILERDIVEKDAEITQLKVHLSELNLHAEAQASDYKQKFKALEAMAEQVRPEGHSAQLMNSLSNKSEKYATKSRGSGSPFKCIGLGLAHQIKSEKDEELTAAKLHIEELEFLAVSRQKEIFALNARLAAAESMTHDVIRDLLGVKLDMTNYASMLDNEQVQKITEKARLHSLESQEKEQEVVKLKKQLNEFVEERRGWLEEIDRKQAEMVGAQIALEKLWRQDQLHKTENEMLKIENLHRKQKVMELEGEVKKLSGQQNLQQRIHHHAKIKDENNMLKTQNEELSSKLRRTEVILSRVKEELACFRASIGKNPYIDFDEEHRLNIKLKETEEEKVQLAQRLLGLCTSVLKAVGITKPVSNVSPSDAEDALEQLKNRFTALERELQDLKYKNRLTNERIRLTELMPQSSPINSADEKCRTPGRASQAAFFSALDR
ncbi:kinesin-like protein KIN-12D isoform X2 [Juglans regia]|uniref:Kinesin-like protein KIN-12D isoform X2 n=1 Tax=Juglans regia TaxID=51240 RepID=A0A6P9ED64_JUGRE|nr:kinesin-like protein KIN-12D isoform X2 [Juglans regia]